MDIGGIDHLGIDRVLKRGTGEIIANEENALLVRDSVSGAYMLACNDEKVGMALLDRHLGPDGRLLMVADHALGMTAYDRYGFSEKIECYQVAYFGEKPTPGSELTVKTADESDLSMLVENYDMLSPEELAEVVARKAILIGYHDGRPVGFIGEHLEGSMGILYVLPEYRQMGFGTALQTHFIAQTMERGLVPFGQVEKDNRKSLGLQEKLGMTISDELIVWMWK